MQEKYKHECVIGIWWQHEITELVTLNRFKEIIDDPYNKLSLNDYCNKTYDGNVNDLEKFDYCPFCGEKIKWDTFK